MRATYTLLFFSFLILSLSISTSNAVTCSKFEYYDATPPNQYSSNCGYWSTAQTFKPAVTHTIHYLRLVLCKLGNPQIATISVTNTSAGVPTGVLASGIFDSNRVGNMTYPEWYQIDLVVPIQLMVNVTYAIIVSAPNGNFTNGDILFWAGRGPTGYAKGNQLLTEDGGETWVNYANVDMLFEDWGYTPVPPILTSPIFLTMLQVGIISAGLGYGFSQVGERMGHPTGGFIIGGGIGLVVCAQTGLLSVWILTAILLIATIAVYFWFTGD